ncbi:restriction endonuclease [Nitrosomonas sp. Is79A3]|uniref:restriction endonuclease n=1 Tax=Nitrosomonas sp. (strain Is79A3) TaxID=261292 RepID=UPI000215D22D
MSEDWSEYQEEAAEFFRSLGLEANTNVTIQGVRTKHVIDVVVKSQHAGFEITWIVECKLWNSRVSKLHVLALREIVADTGADRGILLAEKGFQSGASEAAALTNVHLTSLADTRREARDEVFSMRLSELYDRVESASKQYWSIPKRVRIEHDLRQDLLEDGYCGASVISLVEDLLKKGFRGTYPFKTNHIFRYAESEFPEIINSAEELVVHLEHLVSELEYRIGTCLKAINVTMP